MNYSVKELREKLSERILGLGIDSKFLENPAFGSAISQIDSLIGQMGMHEAAEVVNVRDENGNISFEWMSTVGDKYSMSITSSSPETFRCIRTEEKKAFLGTNQQFVRQKNVVEEVATIDKSGFITLTTNGSMVDDIDCRMGKCNNSTWSEKSYYTSNGVMRDRELKSFATCELSEDFDRTRIDSMLYIPRQAFDFGFWYNHYESYSSLRRDKLDTARFTLDDKRQEIEYNAIVPLSQEHGLMNMIVNFGSDYPQDIVISPLSQSEIEAMIQKESNPKVAEGLREFAIGREAYAYSSLYDNNFVCKGVSNNQGVSR